MARFIVTGTPRTATGYATLFFRELNLPCTHERIFRPRGTLAEILDWYKHGDSGESSWLAWVFLGLLPGPVPVLHTTRNPWAVIDSLAYRNDLIPKEARVDRGKQQLRNAIELYCPDVMRYDDPIDRAAAFVLAWNKHIVSTVAHYECPYLRYRAEDMGGEQVKAMLEFIDEYRDSYEIDNALANVPRNVNAGKRLEHGVEITNPAILDVLAKVAPSAPPIIDCAMQVDVPRTPDELEENMNPRLREALGELAKDHGYARTVIGAVEEEGVKTDASYEISLVR